MITIDRLDHLVLTVASIESTCDFYQRVLGMAREEFGAGRVALSFGNQKINLHQVGEEILPKAKFPTAGSADLCFISNLSMAKTILQIEAHKVSIEKGPVARTGATGNISSIYFRDPDNNLIELSVYS